MSYRCLKYIKFSIELLEFCDAELTWCGKPTEDAYSSGHLALSHFGTCKCSKRPMYPELVLFPDFWVSNIPRYFCFCFVRLNWILCYRGDFCSTELTHVRQNWLLWYRIEFWVTKLTSVQQIWPLCNFEGSSMVVTGILSNNMNHSSSLMLHDILEDDHIQWQPPLIRLYISFDPVTKQDLLPNLTFT